MTSITQNFLKILKRQLPSEYTLNELHDLGLDLLTIYMYTSDPEDIKELREVYHKIQEWINTQNKGYAMNPASTFNIDKQRDKELVYHPKEPSSVGHTL